MPLETIEINGTDLSIHRECVHINAPITRKEIESKIEAELPDVEAARSLISEIYDNRATCTVDRINFMKGGKPIKRIRVLPKKTIEKTPRRRATRQKLEQPESAV